MLFKSGLLETRSEQAGFVQLPGQQSRCSGGAGEGASFSLFCTHCLVLFQPQRPEGRACAGLSTYMLPPANPQWLQWEESWPGEGTLTLVYLITGQTQTQENLPQRSPELGDLLPSPR